MRLLFILSYCAVVVSACSLKVDITASMWVSSVKHFFLQSLYYYRSTRGCCSICLWLAGS